MVGGDFISAIINMVTTLVDGYTKKAGIQAAFKRQGEIANQVVNEMQERYSNLEDQIGQAALTQYQEDIQKETEKKVIAGNLTSLTIAIVVTIIVVVLTFWILKKDK